MATFDVTVGSAGITRADRGTTVSSAIAAANTLAINKLISDITTSPFRGGTIYFPEGEYWIDAPLILKENITLRGDGPKASVIHQSSQAHGLFLERGSEAFITIENLSVSGSFSPSDEGWASPDLVVGNGDGIHLTENPLAHVVIRNCLIRWFSGHGLCLGGANETLIDTVESLRNGLDGFHFEGRLSFITSLSVVGCYANQNRQHGYYLDNLQSGIRGGTYSAFVGCASDSNTINYHVKDAYNVSFTGCGSEWASENDPNAKGTSRGWQITHCHGITITSCFVENNPGIGFLLTGSTFYTSLIGNRVSEALESATADFQVDLGSHGILINNESAATGAHTGSRKDFVIDGIATIINDTSEDEGNTSKLRLQNGSRSMLNVQANGRLQWAVDPSHPELTPVNLYRYSKDGDPDDVGVLRTDAALAMRRVTPSTRPDPAKAGIGAMVYDTELLQPIWSDGERWRDARGRRV